MSTKEKILDAALTLFAENGYDGKNLVHNAGFPETEIEKAIIENEIGMFAIC